MTREIKVDCPQAEPIFDRSFAVSPPPCLKEFAPSFLFPEGAWGVQGVEATKEITDQERCLKETQAWYLEEIRSRNK